MNGENTNIEAKEEAKSPYLVVFKKPFFFEGVTYENVDLSGLEAVNLME